MSTWGIGNTMTDDTDDGWFEHRGGPCPVPPEKEVFVKYRNAISSPKVYAKQRRWEAWPSEVGDSDWDIVEWKPAKLSAMCRVTTGI